MPIPTKYFTWCNKLDAEVISWSDLVEHNLTHALEYVNGELGFAMINPASRLAWFNMINPTYDTHRNLIEQVFYCSEYDTYVVVSYDRANTLRDFG